MATKNKHKLITALRRRIKVQRKFTVEDMKDGREKQTCQTCGAVKYYTYPGTYNSVIEKLIKYRQHNGLHGICPKCSKEFAEKKYPL